MESKAQLIGRIARRCLGILGALWEDFATIGFAHYGYPVELYHRREDAFRNHEPSECEDSSRREKEDTSQGEKVPAQRWQDRSRTGSKK